MTHTKETLFSRLVCACHRAERFIGDLKCTPEARKVWAALVQVTQDAEVIRRREKYDRMRARKAGVIGTAVSRGE